MRLAGEIQIYQNGNESVTIGGLGELSPLLGWLATLPLAEVRIEPFRLR